MNNLHQRFCLMALFLTALTLAACAAAHQQLAARTQAGLDEVYKACIDAVIDAHFGVTSSDPKTGLIVAEQAVYGGDGARVKLNIAVRRVGEVTEVSVSYVPPPIATVRLSAEGGAETYVRALKKRIPDVEIVQGG